MSPRLRELVLTGLIAFGLMGVDAVVAQERVANQPMAQGGLLDLSDWSFDRNGVVDLDGEWTFYWQQHLYPGQVKQRAPDSGTQLRVPGYWNSESAYPAMGFATYRLEILVADLSPLAIKFRSVGTAYRLIIDGETLLEVGLVGQSAATSIPEYRAKTVNFTPKSRRVEVLIHISNYHHRNAGLWEKVQLGYPDDLSRLREIRLSMDLVLYGAIVMMALYNLITWLTRRENISSLYLGLFCVLLSARILLVDERHVNEILPGIGWEVLTRLEFFLWMISMPIFLNFIRSIFPTELSVMVLRVFWVLSLVFAAMAALLPISYATEIVPPFQAITLAGMAYGAFGIGRAISRGKEGSYLVALSVLFLFAAALSDILTIIFALDLDNRMQIGLFMFVLLQSIHVSLRSSKAFQTVEAQSSELRKSNLELHIQEKLRRAAEGQPQALRLQVGHEHRANSYSVVASAVGHRVINDPTEAEAAGQTLKDLAIFLRGEQPTRQALNLGEQLSDFFVSNAYSTLKSRFPLVEVSTQLDDSDGAFMWLPTQLDSLLFHLMRYSLATQVHAQRIIVTGKMDYIFAGSVFHHQIKDGHYYILGIEDQGQGIRPEDLVEIFDPKQLKQGFSDLKPVLQDLAVAWTILDFHGGTLDLQTRADANRLELYFPMEKS